MGHQQSPADYENQIVALGRVLQTLREEENVDVLIETTLNYLVSEFEYRLIWISLYDKLDHRLFGKGGITPTSDTKFLKNKFTLTPGDLLEQVVIQQRPVSVPNLSEEVRAGEWRRAAQEFGVQGALFFPLRCKDRCYGVVLLGSHVWGGSQSASEKAQMSLLFGGLATALYQIELDWQHSSTKRPDQPLFQVIDQMARFPTMQQRLEAVVAMTQQFIAPTRTSIYWYSPERRYFWHRVGNRHTSKGLTNPLTSAAAGITLQEVSEFYQALNENRLIAIGAGRSPLKAEVTGQLLSRLRARSLLAAPILVQQELVGFLAVEGNEARIWEEAEKNYIRAAAQLIALGAGSEEIETTLVSTQQDAQLVAECARAIADNTDADKALDQCAQLLLNRLGVERFLIVQGLETGDWRLGAGNQEGKESFPQAAPSSNPPSSSPYTIVYQRQPLNRRPLTTGLMRLTDSQQQLFEPSESSVVAIEDWEQDQRLLSWKESLGVVGVRSLLVCPIVQDADTSFSCFLVICHSTPRTWSQTERSLVGIVSQQLSVAVRTFNLRTLTKLSESAQLHLHNGLQMLLSASSDQAQSDRALVQFLSEMLECPLAMLLDWEGTTERHKTGKVAAAVMANPRFALSPGLSVPPTDLLIQEALATDGLVEKRGTQIPTSSRQWLSSPGIGCLLIMALPDFAKQANLDFGLSEDDSNPKSKIQNPKLAGFIILADDRGREWSKHLLPVLETLVRQFARIRRYNLLSATLHQEVRNLEQLNWYKHRCLESLHQATTDRINRLNELESPAKGNQPDKSLVRMHSTQLLRELENILTEFTPLLQEEQWQLRQHLTRVTLTSVLKRSLLLLAPLYHERQLQVRSGGASSNQDVYADPLKLECVLCEILSVAGRLAPVGSRINIKTEVKSANEQSLFPSSDTSGHAARPGSLTPPLLELLITNSETFNFKVLAAPKLPALKICQRFVRSFGGNLQFYQMEGNRYLTRLLLPTTIKSV